MPVVGSRSESKPTALGVHIFAGGFTVGVKAAGFNVLGHLEDTPYGVATAKHNLGVKVKVGFDEWELENYINQVDLMYCNPPCAIFSSAGIVTTRGEGSWRDDPRLGCWERVRTAFMVIRPKVLAVESVCQAYTRGRELIDSMTTEAIAAGYRVDHVMMDAKYVGLPQSRRRFFLLAYEPSLLIDLKTGYSENNLVTVRQILESIDTPIEIDNEYTNRSKGANFSQWIEKTKPGHQLREAFDLDYSPFSGANCAEEDMAATPPGGYVRNIFDQKYKNKKKGRPGFMHRRLPLDTQSGAFVGDVYAHPIENRYLNVREMKAICGYPHDFWLEGSHGGKASLLARAVLPPVGLWLALAVRAALTGPRVTESLIVRFLDMRKVNKTEPTKFTKLVAPIQPVTEKLIIKPVINPVKTYRNTVTLPSHRSVLTALVTGSTPVQVGSERTEMDIVTAVRGYVAALEEMGYSVDWRPVTPGEDVSSYDVVLAAIQKPNSIASRYFYGALWVLSRRPDAIAIVDDWQTESILNGAKTYAKGPERAFRLRSEKDLGGEAKTLFDDLVTFAEGNWSWPVLVPTIGDGDVSLLKIPAAKVVPVDPTSFSRRYRKLGPRPTKQRVWVHASLMTKDLPTMEWPVDGYGFSDKGKGGVGPSGPMAKPRLRESELADVYLRNWGVLSPPHPHAGSGWWRVRYLMSADAGCILSACEAEAACLGDAYVEASDASLVEVMGDGQLKELASRQRDQLNELTWSRDRVKQTIADVITESR